MNEIDAATKALCAAKTAHKERMKAHVDNVVVNTMRRLADNIKTASIDVEVITVRVEDFNHQGDIGFIQFSRIMQEKLGPDLSIHWRSGMGIPKEYASIALRISAFSV